MDGGKAGLRIVYSNQKEKKEVIGCETEKVWKRWTRPIKITDAFFSVSETDKADDLGLFRQRRQLQVRQVLQVNWNGTLKQKTPKLA